LFSNRKNFFCFIFINRKASVNDISIQCNQINDCVNRSTQTIDSINKNNDFIEEYSLRTVGLFNLKRKFNILFK